MIRIALQTEPTNKEERRTIIGPSMCTMLVPVCDLCLQLDVLCKSGTFVLRGTSVHRTMLVTCTLDILHGSFKEIVYNSSSELTSMSKKCLVLQIHSPTLGLSI